MSRRRNFAFIAELFILFVILLFVVIVITKTFVTSRNQSLYARHLTESVYLAEEVAEISMASEDLEETAEVLKELSQTEEVTTEADWLEVSMDFDEKDGKRDNYRVILTWEEEPGTAGTYRSGDILVFFEDEAEPIYILQTGSYENQ